MEAIRMSKEGRVLIPAELRKALDLRPDEPLSMYVEDGELRIVARRQAIKAMQARVAPYKPKDGASVVDELIRERRDEAARD
ncbi:AbrB/MazE/SpoVT family DNA-binding domain-containing protein [Roseateles sp.]|uniref:AbrB/MazE/SpoVT family DNA-binding domain-containing protein n=1 Tax=Roseateles sp. TaxID=1971397 RepID=UPI0032631902